MNALTDSQGRILLDVARRAITEVVAQPPRSTAAIRNRGRSSSTAGRSNSVPETPLARPPWLDEPGAAFVTLKQDGELRGCIGSLAATRPLGVDVAENAVAAALRDPRFPALRPSELDVIQVSVSVLGPAVPLAAAGRAEAESLLRPGRDGVLLDAGRHHATFLPQVWEDLPDPADFLAHLLRKAGLPPRSWPDGIRLSTYQVALFSEPVRSPSGTEEPSKSRA